MLQKLRKLIEPPPIRQFSLGEEITHSVTHGIGTALSVFGFILLVILAVLYGNKYQIISFTVFGATLVLLYLSSTLYHGFQRPHIKKIFKRFDHASIYLLIAGTYTPFLLISLRGSLGWTLLAIVWGIAILGVSFKILFIEKFQVLSVVSYLLMGWLSVVALRQLIAALPIGGIIWLAIGGFFYTIGVIFYAYQRIPYMHAVWHLFVMGGSISHYLAVLLYLAPIR